MSLTALYDLPAPAKLNLFLHVVGRRPDGYHLLQSVFTLIDWADTLHMELRRDGQLQRHDLGPALPADDLCLRAARALQKASGCTMGADISIDKQVPWGAGLGGGSSDAATTLLALNRLWGLNWPRERLLALGLTLGADVPFFIGGRSAFVEGIGEQLTPITLPPQAYAVVKPPAAIATAAIFSSPLLTRDHEAVIVTGFLAHLKQRTEQQGGDGRQADLRGEPQKLQVAGENANIASSEGGVHAEFGSNDLQRAAEALCPEVAEVGRWLEARFGNSRMTGSGSAVFARMNATGAGASPVATKPEGELKDLPAGWVGRTCRGLAEHPLIGWAA